MIPIKPKNWRTSQTAPGDFLVEQFTEPIGDIRGMLENFESLCRAGRWIEALAALQMTSKWILKIQSDLLEFVGNPREASIRTAQDMKGNRSQDNLQRLRHIKNDIENIEALLRDWDFDAAFSLINRVSEKIARLSEGVSVMSSSGRYIKREPKNRPIWGYLEDGEMGWIQPSDPEYKEQMENWRYLPVGYDENADWPSDEFLWNNFFSSDEARNDPRFQTGFTSTIPEGPYTRCNMCGKTMNGLRSHCPDPECGSGNITWHNAPEEGDPVLESAKRTWKKVWQDDGYPIRQASKFRERTIPLNLRTAQMNDPTVQCSWCKATKQGDEWKPSSELLENATHGICPECSKSLSDQIEALPQGAVARILRLDEGEPDDLTRTKLQLERLMDSLQAGDIPPHEKKKAWEEIERLEEKMMMLEDEGETWGKRPVQAGVMGDALLMNIEKTMKYNHEQTGDRSMMKRRFSSFLPGMPRISSISHDEEMTNRSDEGLSGSIPRFGGIWIEGSNPSILVREGGVRGMRIGSVFSGKSSKESREVSREEMDEGVPEYTDCSNCGRQAHLVSVSEELGYLCGACGSMTRIPNPVGPLVRMYGRDYPEMCDECRGVIDMVGELIGEESDDPEGALTYAADHGMLCGGDHCGRVRSSSGGGWVRSSSEDASSDICPRCGGSGLYTGGKWGERRKCYHCKGTGHVDRVVESALDGSRGKRWGSGRLVAEGLMRIARVLVSEGRLEEADRVVSSMERMSDFPPDPNPDEASEIDWSPSPPTVPGFYWFKGRSSNHDGVWLTEGFFFGNDDELSFTAMREGFPPFGMDLDETEGVWAPAHPPRSSSLDNDELLRLADELDDEGLFSESDRAVGIVLARIDSSMNRFSQKVGVQKVGPPPVPQKIPGNWGARQPGSLPGQKRAPVWKQTPVPRKVTNWDKLKAVFLPQPRAEGANVPAGIQGESRLEMGRVGSKDFCPDCGNEMFGDRCEVCHPRMRREVRLRS